MNNYMRGTSFGFPPADVPKNSAGQSNIRNKQPATVDSNPTINTDLREQSSSELTPMAILVKFWNDMKVGNYSDSRVSSTTGKPFLEAEQAINDLITTALRARETEIELNALKWVVSESRAGRNGVWLQERQSSQGKQSTVHDRIAQLESTLTPKDGEMENRNV